MLSYGELLELRAYDSPLIVVDLRGTMLRALLARNARHAGRADFLYFSASVEYALRVRKPAAGEGSGSNSPEPSPTQPPAVAAASSSSSSSSAAAAASSSSGADGGELPSGGFGPEQLDGGALELVGSSVRVAGAPLNDALWYTCVLSEYVLHTLLKALPEREVRREQPLGCGERGAVRDFLQRGGELSPEG